MNTKIKQIPQRSFGDNWDFQQKYYDQVKEILKKNAGEFIKINIADNEKDMKQATDFVVIVDGGEVAVRIRRYSCKFRDLTIRSINRQSKTEIHKIREGFGKYYLYCWENPHKELDSWILVDLDIVRATGLLEDHRDIPNGDGTYFIAITLQELFRNNCLLAHQGVSI